VLVVELSQTQCARVRRFIKASPRRFAAVSPRIHPQILRKRQKILTQLARLARRFAQRSYEADQAAEGGDRLRSGSEPDLPVRGRRGYDKSAAFDEEVWCAVIRHNPSTKTQMTCSQPMLYPTYDLGLTDAGKSPSFYGEPCRTELAFQRILASPPRTTQTLHRRRRSSIRAPKPPNNTTTSNSGTTVMVTKWVAPLVSPTKLLPAVRSL